MSKKEAVASKSIPIQRTDLSTFDDSFSFLKEKFTAEMKKMDEEMNKFSSDLRALYGQTSTTPVATALTSSPTWEALANSPLIQGEGEDKMLKLQFDLSSFDPAEIKIQILEDVLIVSAVHQEKTDNQEVLKEFKREFLLPRGTDPNSVISSLSRDGVLTVQAPLPPLSAIEEAQDQDPNVLAKNPPEVKIKKAEKGPQIPKPADEAKIATPPAAQTAQAPLSPTAAASPQDLPAPPPPVKESKLSTKASKQK